MKTIKVTFLLIFLSAFNLNSQVVFSETFSTSLGQCSSTNSVSGAWVFANACTASANTGHSATGHALFQGSACDFGNGSNTVSGNLNTPTIAIGSSGAVLTFNYRLVTECGTNNAACSYDVLSLQISTNGGTSFTTIMASSGAPSGLYHNSSWTPVSYTLNAYSNQTIIIRFNFNSIDGIGNNYDGVYVDDIVVTSNCSINLTSSPANSSVSPVICSGNSVTLTTNAVSNYSWSNGATTPSIVVSPTNNATYSVTATSSANCISSASLNVQVNNSVPILTVANTASATNGACPNSTVLLNASGANTYTWSGGSTAVTNGVAFFPTTAATYTVVGANACGTSSAAASISIHPVPTVTAIASTASLCSGSSATLTGIGTATSFVWSGAPFTITNGVGFNPSSTSVYTVVGMGAKSCTASATIPITVVTTPSLAPTASPVLICIGKSSTLSATGASNYTWTSSTGVIANTSSVVVSPTAAINTYTIVKSNANCVDTKTMNVFVNQLPTIFAIVSPTLVCAGSPASLAVGGGQTYTWTSPGPPTYTFGGASPIVSPLVSSTYTVAASDGTCVNTTTVFLATDPVPTIAISVSASSVICNGQSVTLSATGGNNYTWTASTGTFYTSSITDSPTAPISYQVKADNSFSCTSVNSQIVLVNPLPNVGAVANKTLVCSGNPSTLTATGANTYTWDSGVTTSVTVVSPTATSVYTVTGKFTSTQCQNTKTVQVKVFTPSITVTQPTNTCFGGNITLSASGANPNTYNWNLGSGFTNPFQSIAVTPTVFTIYTVSAMSTSNTVNCASTATTSIGIFYNPTITVVPQRTFVCRNESVDLYGDGGISYSWSNAQTGGTITVSPLTNTNYTVTGTDANGCVSTGTIQVKVSSCSGINELTSQNAGVVVYPNPNNGEFMLHATSDITLTLTNELGQLVRVIELKAANNHQVSVNDLAKGIYFVSGKNGNSQVNTKIVVVK